MNSCLSIVTTGLFLALSALAQTTDYSIDVPGQLKTYSGQQIFGGWAVDSQSEIAYIIVLLDDQVVGVGPYGGYRQDACNVYVDYPGCPNVGWSYALNTSQLINGYHYLSAIIYKVDGTSYTTPAVTFSTATRLLL